jgi:hypothetical protein
LVESADAAPQIWRTDWLKTHALRFIQSNNAVFEYKVHVEKAAVNIHGI